MDNITIKNLNKRYKDKLVFNDFSTKVLKGKKNFLIGVSGSGKTTLIRILLGLEDYQGDINIETGSKFSVVFQEDRLLENLSIYDNLDLVNPGKYDRETIKDELFSIGLENLIDKKVRELSGGMKRRVSILRALLVDSDIYVLDEPFKELDADSYRLCVEYFKQKMNGKTVIMTSHNKDEVLELSENNIIISKLEYER
ncbi:MAG: ABC transporter ATP-binding protein [Tissierellia bacterium]|nr:ABC transporter ATP-binding protein [Tissierellia bacterium]